MNVRQPKITLVVAFAVALAEIASQARAVEVELHAVQAPERQEFKLPFAPTELAGGAELSAEVQVREGQGKIAASFARLKPAVLFGGDVTAYVLWALTLDGKVENLGELWVRSEKDTARFATGLKDFALLVTVESHFLADRPSELVVFRSLPSKSRHVRSRPFRFSAFSPAPATGTRDISSVSYTGSKPLDLVQAEKVYELAERAEAADFAPQAMRDARIALAQARTLDEHSAGLKQVVDYSRRSVALASEAMRVTSRTLEERRQAEEAARRRAELGALEERAAGAESAYRDAEAEKEALAAQIQESQQALEALRSDRELLGAETARLAADKELLAEERARLEAEVGRIEGERGELASQLTGLEEQTAALEARRQALESANSELEVLTQRLREEKEGLQQRLQNALGAVAETRSTARGLVVSLPDILFDVDRATLRPEATLALAKLVGILSLMPELNLRIEGHTDSTGTPEYNQQLSENRSRSVLAFLSREGIEARRLTAVGYGLERPVADNATAAGRAKNRRVEIVIAEGEVGEAAAEPSR